MSIVTSTEVAAYMDVKVTDTTSIANITAYIGIAEDRIVKHIRQEIEKQTDVVQVFHGTGVYEYVIGNFPVIDVSKVEIRSGLSVAWATVDTDDYEVLVKDTGFSAVIMHDTFLSGNYNYRITYDYGFESEDIPLDIKESVIRLVVYLLNNSEIKVLGKGRLGVSSISSSDITGASNTSTSYLNVWNKVKGDINNYKALLRM